MNNINIDPNLQRRAESGDRDAIRKIIDHYYTFHKGNIQERRPVSERILFWHKKLAAVSNDPDDWHKLGLFLRYEFNDYKESAFWIKKAADAGHINAMGTIGADYYSGIPGVVRADPAMAQYWWDREEAAKNPAPSISHYQTYDAENCALPEQTEIPAGSSDTVSSRGSAAAFFSMICAAGLYTLFFYRILLPLAFWCNTSFIGMILWLLPVFPLSLVMGLSCFMTAKPVEKGILYRILKLVCTFAGPAVIAYLTIKDGAVTGLGTGIVFLLFIAVLSAFSVIFSLAGHLITMLKSSRSPGRVKQAVLFILMIIILAVSFTGWRESVELAGFIGENLPVF